MMAGPPVQALWPSEWNGSRNARRPSEAELKYSCMPARLRAVRLHELAVRVFQMTDQRRDLLLWDSARCGGYARSCQRRTALLVLPPINPMRCRLHGLPPFATMPLATDLTCRSFSRSGRRAGMSGCAWTSVVRIAPGGAAVSGGVWGASSRPRLWCGGATSN